MAMRGMTKRGRRPIARLGKVLPSGTAVALLVVACTQSGQILEDLQKQSGDEKPPALGGAPPAEGAGGTTEGAGGTSEGAGGTTEGAGGTTEGAGGASEGAGGTSEGMGGSSDPIVAPGPLGSEVFVESGDGHTCAVFDGTLYCWGENQDGQLGLGDFEARSSPTQIGTDEDWVTVGAGGEFSCALRQGRVWCWGEGSSGQLGVGKFSASPSPVEVTLAGDAAKLSVGDNHACVILVDGRLYCWGLNAEGQLAQNDPWPGPGANSALPLEVDAGQTYDSVAAGQGHTCGIRTDGSLWCWGRNARGELGLGPSAAGQLRSPMQVGVEEDFSIVSAGQNHTCAIRGGELYCWGENTSSQLGVPIGEFTSEPTLISDVVDPGFVSVDTFHTCAIDQGGDLFCWGRNIEGQLGDGTITARDVPTKALPEGQWEEVSAGRFHTCGVRAGAVLCSGENSTGRLGTGDSERRREFTPTVTSN